jgi:hypothetical protein
VYHRLRFTPLVRVGIGGGVGGRIAATRAVVVPRVPQGPVVRRLGSLKQRRVGPVSIQPIPCTAPQRIRYMVSRRRAPKICISVATLVEVTRPIVRPMRETRRGRINGGGGTPWDGCRLVIFRAQASLVQLMLHVVGLRGGFDIHEGHSGGKTSGPVFLLEPWQQLDTLNAPIVVFHLSFVPCFPSQSRVTSAAVCPK